jgi:hypothetical protein
LFFLWLALHIQEPTPKTILCRAGAGQRDPDGDANLGLSGSRCLEESNGIHDHAALRIDDL